MPRFSIVVPAYNAHVTLAETLEAVLAQSFADWECIVVDDGSTDETRRIADSFANRDPRFRVMFQENQGSAGAYNTGVASAQGDLVVLCSADDVLLPEHLSEMADFAERNPGFAIYSSNGYYLSPGGSREIVYFDGEVPPSLSLADVIRECFYSVGAAYRRELYAAVGGYRVDVYGEDYDFWLRAMAHGAKHRYLARPLSMHRLGPDQKSARSEAVLRSDIRLVTDLLRSPNLSDDELHAVDEAVEAREALIARLHAPQGVRSLVVKAAQALLGRAGVRRAIRAVRGNRPRKSGHV